MGFLNDLKAMYVIWLPLHSPNNPVCVFIGGFLHFLPSYSSYESGALPNGNMQYKTRF